MNCEETLNIDFSKRSTLADEIQLLKRENEKLSQEFKALAMTLKRCKKQLERKETIISRLQKQSERTSHRLDGIDGLPNFDSGKHLAAPSVSVGLASRQQQDERARSRQCDSNYASMSGVSPEAAASHV